MKIYATAFAPILLVNASSASDSQYSILSNSVCKRDGIPHCSSNKRNGLAILKRSFVQEIKVNVGVNPFVSDKGSSDVVVQTTFFTSTTNRHVDRLPPNENGCRPTVPGGDYVAFIPLNTNPDAHLDVDDTCVPIEEGRLVKFSGTSPHHSVVNSGHVNLLGPFHVKSMESVGTGICSEAFASYTCCASPGINCLSGSTPDPCDCAKELCCDSCTAAPTPAPAPLSAKSAKGGTKMPRANKRRKSTKSPH